MAVTMTEPSKKKVLALLRGLMLLGLLTLQGRTAALPWYPRQSQS